MKARESPGFGPRGDLIRGVWGAEGVRTGMRIGWPTVSGSAAFKEAVGEPV